jgi:hypothetical protein
MSFLAAVDTFRSGPSRPRPRFFLARGTKLVNILLTIEFSVFTIEASGEQYTGGGADPETHILNAKKS